jgi:hypothetical protein
MDAQGETHAFSTTRNRAIRERERERERERDRERERASERKGGDHAITKNSACVSHAAPFFLGMAIPDALRGLHRELWGYKQR